MTPQLIEDEIDIALNDVARKFAASNYNFETRRRLDADERRFSASTWASVAEMGWLGVATPEAHGGFGVRISSVAVLAEGAGAMFLNEPLGDTAFCGAYLVGELGSAAQRAWLCPRICNGSLRLAVALEPPELLPDGARPVTAEQGNRLSGSLPFVPGADIADAIIVCATDASGQTDVYLVDSKSEGVNISPYPLIDGRGAATVTFHRAASERLGEGAPGAEATVARARDRRVGQRSRFLGRHVFGS